ncbi:methyl-accepting chemotaxis protein [Natranaerovirga pectinivora]|uniref:Methyl-accepting chemotaxis protein n=1 Tax=Natranaerovirga pectinivora TaxID=682400 RepID=A0A4R3MI86_9FIRM|nr:methyl-accepting chemotaxis protein [Natranaerovirga pectinivora]TCT12995.1 methyl-accepting chemotaxis protein [Natranaerovirga pectinivora]
MLISKFKFKNLSIGLKYGITVTVIIVLFMLSSVLVNSYLMRINREVKELNIINDHTLALNALDKITKDKNIKIADYIDYKDEELVVEYDGLITLFQYTYNNLIIGIEDEEILDLLNQIYETNSQMDDVFKNRILTQVRIGNMDSARSRRSIVVNIQYIIGNRLLEIQDLMESLREVSIRDVDTAIRDTRVTLIISIIVGAILSIFILLLVSLKIKSYFNKLIVLNEEIAKGNLTSEDINYNGTDEIGKLSRATMEMVNNIKGIIKDVMASSSNMNNSSVELTNLAKEVKEVNEQISATMEEMSVGAEEQANAGTKVLYSVERLNHLINDSNDKGKKLNESTNEAMSIAKAGEANMLDSIQKMDRISKMVKELGHKIKNLDDKSKNIYKLVEVINSIAEETNLLALNAAIEAARAGEAGRGFAVVADEIRKLAEQSGKSVLEITRIVDEVQSDSKEMTNALEEGYTVIEDGSNQIKITEESFEAIHSVILLMVDEIKEVVNSFSIIKDNSVEIENSIEHIASISQENSAAIEETCASIEQQENSMGIVLDKSKDLLYLAEKLNNIIKTFRV